MKRGPKPGTNRIRNQSKTCVPPGAKTHLIGWKFSQLNVIAQSTDGGGNDWLFTSGDLKRC